MLALALLGAACGGGSEGAAPDRRAAARTQVAATTVTVPERAAVLSVLLNGPAAGSRLVAPAGRIVAPALAPAVADAGDARDADDPGLPWVAIGGVVVGIGVFLLLVLAVRVLRRRPDDHGSDPTG
ncbi:MAG: hypothetical protein ACKOVH_04750 [Actinomycetota bacterium]